MKLKLYACLQSFSFLFITIFSHQVFSLPDKSLTLDGSYNCDGTIIDIKKLESFPVGYMIWLDQETSPVILEEDFLDLTRDPGQGSISIRSHGLVDNFSFKNCSPMELIGGSYARPGQFPGVVSIRACSSRRVGKKKFLLAGHCVASQGSSRSDMLMSPFLKGRQISIEYGVDLSKSHRVRIKNTYLHPKYRELLISGKNNGPEAHDIAVIEVEEDIDVEEIEVGSFTYDALNTGEKIILTGYGCQGDKHARSTEPYGVLKFGAVVLSQTFGSVGFSRDMETRVCSGDSGGSAFIGNGKNGYVTIGVNSYKWVRKGQSSVMTLLSHSGIKEFLIPIIGSGVSIDEVDFSGPVQGRDSGEPDITKSKTNTSSIAQEVIQKLKSLQAAGDKDFSCLSNDGDIGTPAPGYVSVWSYKIKDYITILVDRGNLNIIIDKFKSYELCSAL